MAHQKDIQSPSHRGHVLSRRYLQINQLISSLAVSHSELCESEKVTMTLLTTLSCCGVELLDIDVISFVLVDVTQGDHCFHCIFACGVFFLKVSFEFCGDNLTKEARKKMRHLNQPSADPTPKCLIHSCSMS